jgi:hypothetical protein
LPSRPWSTSRFGVFLLMPGSLKRRSTSWTSGAGFKSRTQTLQIDEIIPPSALQLGALVLSSCRQLWSSPLLSRQCEFKKSRQSNGLWDTRLSCLFELPLWRPQVTPHHLLHRHPLMTMEIRSVSGDKRHPRRSTVAAMVAPQPEALHPRCPCAPRT